MPILKTYRIFISHAWCPDFEYSSVVELLTNSHLFLWKNVSNPELESQRDTSSEGSFSTLSIKLARQINDCHCALILAGMYHNHSRWIDQQIEFAKNARVPILLLKPIDRAPVHPSLLASCRVVVDWDSVQIIEAIRRFAN